MPKLTMFSLSNAPVTDSQAALVSQGDKVDAEGHAIPFPPPHLMAYPASGETPESHAASGQRNYASMRASLDKAAFSGGRVLDYSCHNGRVLRCFNDDESVTEAWGVDMNAKPIAWCMEHFPPKFHFANISISPHLPFEDRYFDLIYGHSIFTHLDDLHTGWIAEIRRALRVGGLAYFTFLTEDSVRKNLGKDTRVGRLLAEFPEGRSFLDTGQVCYIFKDGVLYTFMKHDYILRRFSAFFELLDLVPAAMSLQDGYLFRRRV